LPITDFDGWDRLDAHERSLGAAATEAGAALARERIKVISRGEMTDVARRSV
jgi:ferredoxin--NADP+ reductase